MSMRARIGKIFGRVFRRSSLQRQYETYLKKYNRYTFSGNMCSNYQQYEAHITKLYHAIEKGLSYQNYRAGFGKDNIERLIQLMECYAQEYDVTAYFYETALSTLYAYVAKNKEHGLVDLELEEKLIGLRGKPNADGGVVTLSPYSADEVKRLGFEAFFKDRHSIRTYSTDPVALDRIKRAISLAQHTPSACNRQGWHARIVESRDVIKEVLSNQNGNRGFGESVDKLIVITGDLRYFNRSRELHQVYIDGGMYAMNILHALHYEHIASVPLSAALTAPQEVNIRRCLKLDDAEVLIMYIGVGNYPDGEAVTTRSARRPADITVV